MELLKSKGPIVVVSRIVLKEVPEKNNLNSWVWRIQVREYRRKLCKKTYKKDFEAVSPFFSIDFSSSKFGTMVINIKDGEETGSTNQWSHLSYMLNLFCMSDRIIVRAGNKRLKKLLYKKARKIKRILEHVQEVSCDNWKIEASATVENGFEPMVRDIKLD